MDSFRRLNFKLPVSWLGFVEIFLKYPFRGFVSWKFFSQITRFVSFRKDSYKNPASLGFCQILGGRVYRGCENFWGRVHLFGVLFYCIFVTKFCKKIWRKGILLSVKVSVKFEQSLAALSLGLASIHTWSKSCCFFVKKTWNNYISCHIISLFGSIHLITRNFKWKPLNVSC